MAIPSAFHGASLELCNLTLAYGPIEVLRNVSLSIEPGTTTCIIGPSGSGNPPYCVASIACMSRRKGVYYWPGDLS